MPNTASTIDNLTKVSLTIHAEGMADDRTRKKSFTFIYGIGPSGITPFEKALFGKKVGDSIVYDLSPADFSETIGHLEFPFREQTGMTAPGSLRVVVEGIVRAPDREVVKAMASGGSCSDCGCGCGGH